MAKTITVRMADGTLIENVPADIDPSQLEKMYQQHSAGSNAAAPPLKAQSVTPAKDLAKGEANFANRARNILGQGLAMGFGDELEAGARTGFGLFGDYQKTRDELRREQQAYEEKNMGEAIGGQILGGLLTGGAGALRAGAVGAGRAALGQGARAGSKALTSPAAKTLMGSENLATKYPGITKVMQSPLASLAKQGAGWGAVGGYGMGEEGIVEDLGNAAKGATIGAALGPVIGGGAGILTRVIKNRATPGNAQFAAEKAVLNRLDGQDLDKLAADMTWERSKGIPTVFGNANPRTVSLLESMANKPHTGEKVADALEDVIYGAKERGSKLVMNELAENKSFFKTQEALKQHAITEAKPLYQKAFDYGQIDDPNLNKLLTNPRFRDAYKQAEVIAANEAQDAGDDIAGFAMKSIYDKDGNLVGLPDVKSLDWVKKYFDRALNIKSLGSGELSQDVANDAMKQSYRNLKKRMLNIMDDKVEVDGVKVYKEARKVWSDDASLMEAGETGRSLLNKSADEVKSIVGKMTDTERNAAQLGYAEAVRKKMTDNAQNRSYALNFFKNPEERARMQAMFPEGKDFKDFQKILKREAEAWQDANTVLRGSQTHRRDMGEKALNEESKNKLLSSAFNLMIGRPFTAAKEIGQGAFDKFSNNLGYAGRVARDEEITKMLTARDPADILKNIERLRGVAPKVAADIAADRRLASTVGSTAARTSAPRDQEARYQRGLQERLQLGRRHGGLV